MADRAGSGSALAPYRAVLRSRLRAQRSYRASFRTDLFGSLLVGAVEFAEVWIIFHNVRMLGGLDLDAVFLVFGLSYTCFSAAQVVAGHLDTLPTFLRAGTLDAFYLRPQPLLAQLLTSDLQLRRLARTAVGVAVLVPGLLRNGLAPDARTVGIVVLSLICGTGIFVAVFVWAAAVQFFLVNGAEVTNAFTYGGSFAANQPAAVFPSALRVVFGYLLPVVFTGYLPALALLRRPAPEFLPEWSFWAAPLALAAVWAVALLLWRLGVRHYQGGGG